MDEERDPRVTLRATDNALNEQKPVQSLVAKCAHGDFDARSQLAGMGVLRTKDGPMGDCAEWLMEHLFGLKRAPIANQKGWDATDEYGRRYQIKARPRIRHSLSWDHNSNPDFDYLIAMVLNEETFDLLLLLCVSCQDFCDLCSGREHLKDCRLRWNHQVRTDPRVKVLYSVPW